MQSLRQSSGRYLRLSAPLSIRSVAAELDVPARSLRDLLDRLQQHQVVIRSGSLLPSSVKGTATLVLCSDGMWEFSGHVHENGFVKHDYAIAAAPQFVDGAGIALMFGHEGSVTDSRDDDFVKRGRDRRISRHWDQLRNRPVTFHLDVGLSLDGMGKVLGEIFVGLVTGIVVVAFAVVFSGKVGAHKDPDGTVHFYREP